MTWQKSHGGASASLRIGDFATKLTVYLLVFLIVFGPNIALASTNSQVDLGKTSFGSGFKLSANAFDGSLQYEVPLTIPPGRNGMQPSLSLTYSSRPTRETNLFGYGWSLSIPYVERRNYTGIENLYATSTFTSSLSGDLTSTSDATVYKAKVDDGDFLQYTYSTSTGWTVKDKQGTVYTFGSASSTQVVDPDNSAHVYRWMLSEVRDTNDNYVSYSYTKDSNQIYPDLITYTNHGTSTGALDVQFTKELRNDVATSTAEGFAVTTKYRISEIKTEVSGSWVRKYALAYTTGDNGERDLLSSVTESGNDGVTTLSLPAITFGYQSATDSWSLDSGWGIPEPIVGEDYQDVGTRFLDVNGDGLPDLLSRVEGSHNNVYLNTGTGWTYNASWTIPIALYATSTGANPGSFMVDINGDGLIDIAKSIQGATTLIYINTGTGWTLSSSTIPVAFANADGFDYGVRVADVNGDGLPDLVRKYTYSGGSESAVWINNGSTWVEDSSWDSLPEPVLDHDAYYDLGTRFLDVNGDGLADVVRRDATVNKVYLNNGNKGWTLSSSTVPVKLMNDGHDEGTRFEDINGDGLVDLIHSQEINGTGVYLNTGGGWAAIDPYQTIPFRIVDVVNQPPLYNVYVDPGTRLLDLNGDGLLDIIQYRSGDPDKVYLRNGSKPDLLSTITNQQGGVTTVTYKATPEYGTNSSLPLTLDTVQELTYNDGINTWNKQYSYEGGTYYTTNIRDRKFAGFSKVTETDDAGYVTKQYFHQGNTSATSTGEYDDSVAKIGKVYRTEVYDNSNNLYSKTINKWDSYDRGDGATFVKLAQTVDFSYDGDSDHKEKASAFTYDNTNGAVTEKTEWGQVTGSNDGTFSDTGSDKFVTTLSYATTSTSTIVALKQETTVDQSAAKVRERKIYYDGLSLGSFTKGNPTKEEQWKTSSTYVDTEKSYNGYGLVTQEKDPRDKTTDYSYDALNLYPATTTNALSQTLGKTYDYSSGKVEQLTDSNGRVFQTVYDALDRVKEEKEPDLTTPSTLVTKKAYTYTDTGFPKKVQSTAYLSSGTSSEAYTYLDGFGRKVQERTEAEGDYVAKDYQYNNRGLLANESLPYFSGGTSFTATTSPASSTLLVRYTYDPLQRVTVVSNNVGTSTNAYDDWKMTTTDAEGNVKDLTRDAFGNLIQVDEHNGTSTYTTAYEYNGNQKLTKLTDAEANVRNFTYDGLGRRLTAQDLHDAGDGTYGTWTYTYDDSGNLTSVVDPKSQTINYTFDDLNRVLTEDYTGASGTEALYAYDSCTEGKGHLCVATSTGAITTYTYNALGLPAGETKNISSTAYTTSRTYDRLGNVTNIVYPDNSEVKYTYNTAGQLEAVAQKESGGSFTDLVTNFDYAPTGKISVKDFANGKRSEYTYDATKLYRLTHILTGTGGTGGADVQDIGYWDGDHVVYFDVNDTSSDFVNPLDEALTSIQTAEPDLVVPQEENSPINGAEIEVPTPAATPILNAPIVEPDKVDVPLDAALKLKAPVEHLLGSREISNGVVKYAYKTDTDIDNVPASEGVITQARKAGFRVTNEESDKRTRYSRTFSTNDPNTFVTEFISGVPQYHRDDSGKWWQADYATTTKAAYDLQVKPVAKNVVSRAIDFISQFIFPRAHADTSTFYPDPDTETNSVDGFIRDRSSDWNGTRNATNGDFVSDSGGEDVVAYSGKDRTRYSIYRGFFLFNTAAIPDNDTIVSATMSLYAMTQILDQDNDGNDFINIYATTPASNTALVTDDYDQIGTTAQSTAIDIGSIAQNAYNDFPLNSTGIGNVSKTGVTKFGTREGHDAVGDTITNNTANQVAVSLAEKTGTSMDPKLVVVHTSAPSTPTSLLTEGQTNPSYILDDTPEFSAIYNDSNASDTAASYEIQVATSTAFTSTKWDSGKIAVTATTTAGSRSPDVSYAGSALTAGTTYYWRIKFWDNYDVAGSWSGGTDSFAVLVQPTNSVQNIYYTYDKVGNITELADYSENGAGKIVVLGYDDINRLTFASTTAASTTPFNQTYAYSAMGNITSKSDKGSYSYAETGYTNPQAVTTIGSASLAYDTNGNLTSYGSSTYAWDYLNRLTSVGTGSATTTYVYDNTMQRVKKTISASSTIYANDLYNTDGTTKTKSIMAGDELIATIETVGSTSTKEYIHADHLGSVNAITNASGTLVQTVDYYPYGSERMSVGSINSQKTYIGKDFDDEANLSYLSARYYDDARGGFTSQDPVFLNMGVDQRTRQALQDPQLLNSYSYARNNPIVNKDDKGEFAHIILGAGAGMLGQYGYDVFNNIQTNGWHWKDFTDVSPAKTFLVRAAQGAAVAATGGIVGGTSLGLLGQMGIMGGASGAVGAAGDAALNQPITPDSVISDTLIGGVTFGVSTLIPKIPGRAPNFATPAFFTGQHTQQSMLNLTTDAGINYVSSILRDISSLVKELQKQKEAPKSTKKNNH